MAKKILLIAAMISLILQANAKVRLHHLIGNNMVLQQQTEARLWGLLALIAYSIQPEPHGSEPKILYWLNPIKLANLLPCVTASATFRKATSAIWGNCLSSHSEQTNGKSHLQQ